MLRPLADNVLIKQTTAETKTEGGMYLPETAATKPNQGEVLSVGPGLITDAGVLVEPRVKVGERVLFRSHSETDMKAGDGSDLIIVKERNLVGVLEG